MTEPQRALIDLRDGAQHVEAGAGAQLLREARVETPRARPGRRVEGLAFADQLEKIPGRIGKAIEVVGDREMLHDVAFRRADDAAIGLDPFGHAASLYSVWLSD